MTYEQREVYLLLCMIGREKEALELKERWEKKRKGGGLTLLLFIWK